MSITSLLKDIIRFYVLQNPDALPGRSSSTFKQKLKARKKQKSKQKIVFFRFVLHPSPKSQLIFFIFHQPFFRYYAIDRQTHREELDAVGSKRNGLADSWRVFKVIWTYGVTVGGAFIVTLSLFPVVCVRVLSTSTNLTWAGRC